MRYTVSQGSAPAMGNVRGMQAGDVLVIRQSARKRKDWARFSDAIRHAAARGADVRWVP